MALWRKIRRGRRGPCGGRERPSSLLWRGSRIPRQRAIRRWYRARFRARRSRCRGLAIRWPSPGDREVGDPQINPGGPASGRERLGVGDVDGERDVPAAARVTGHRHRGRVDRGGIDTGPGPGERQRRVHLRQVQAAVAPPEPGPGVLRGLPPLPGLEPRIPGPPGEERRVGGLLVTDRLLQRNGRHLVQPRQFVGGLHGGQVGAGLGVGRPGLPGLVPLAAPGQGPVPPDHAHAAERAVQHAGLLLVRVRPALVRRPHDQKSYSTKSDM